MSIGHDVNLLGIELFGTDLLGVDLFGTDLVGADLLGANILGWTKTNFSICTMTLQKCVNKTHR